MISENSFEISFTPFQNKEVNKPDLDTQTEMEIYKNKRL